MEARRRVARLVIEYAAGRITNDEFEDRTGLEISRHDPAIREVIDCVWLHYDDIREAYRRTGKDRMAPEDRRRLAKCVMFLRTDLPFEARNALSLVQAFVNLVVGWMPWYWRRQSNRIDVRVWPFTSIDDYKAAIAKPVYLAGEP